MIEFLEKVKEYLAVLLPVVVSFIVLLSKLTKNIKLKNFSESLLEIDEKIKEYVCLAEEFVNYDGKDKKEWVKTRINQYCIENKIMYDESFVDLEIEKLVDISKSVNKRKDEMEKLL